MAIIDVVFTAATAAVEGKVGKKLKKVLKKIVAEDAHEQLAVADALLGKAIKVRYTPELIRCCKV